MFERRNFIARTSELGSQWHNRTMESRRSRVCRLCISSEWIQDGSAGPARVAGDPIRHRAGLGAPSEQPARPYGTDGGSGWIPIRYPSRESPLFERRNFLGMASDLGSQWHNRTMGSRRSRVCRLCISSEWIQNGWPSSWQPAPGPAAGPDRVLVDDNC